MDLSEEAIMKWLVVTLWEVKLDILDFPKHADLIGDVDVLILHDKLKDNETKEDYIKIVESEIPVPINKYVNLNDYTHIFIYQCAGMWLDLPDTRDYTVLYYHTEPLYAPSCYNPDVLFYSWGETEGFFREYYPHSGLTKIFKSGKDYYHLIFSADPEMFSPNEEKIFSGINFVGAVPRTGSRRHSMLHRDIYTNRMIALTHLQDIDAKNKKNNNKTFQRITIFKRGTKDEYYNITSRSFATLCIGGNYCYNYMRMFEAAAAGSIPILFCEDYIRGEGLYKRIKLIHKKNCFYWRNFDDLERINKKIHSKKQDDIDWIEEIRQNAIEWSKTQTHRERIKQILENLNGFIKTRFPSLKSYIQNYDHETIHELGITEDLK